MFDGSCRLVLRWGHAIFLSKGRRSMTPLPDTPQSQPGPTPLSDTALTPAEDNERKRKSRVPRFLADNQAVAPGRKEQPRWRYIPLPAKIHPPNDTHPDTKAQGKRKDHLSHYRLTAYQNAYRTYSASSTNTHSSRRL